MKKLIIVNGTMGVGKSTVCRQLLNDLTPSVYLDGDWCWNMNPFVVSEENKAMVLNNIAFLLNSFLKNSGYEYILFCWVIHEEGIFAEILRRLDTKDYKLYKFTLTCTEKALRERITRDIESGVRQTEVIGRSVARLPLYSGMDTIKVDVSGITALQAAAEIGRIVKADREGES